MAETEPVTAAAAPAQAPASTTPAPDAAPQEGPASATPAQPAPVAPAPALTRSAADALLMVDPTEEVGMERQVAKAKGNPAMVVDNVHVTYRVFGGKKMGTVGMYKPSLFKRIFDRTTTSMGGAITEVHAVRGISFVARQGESIGIVGRNGAGKSTLLRAIAGLMPYSAGTVYANGQISLLGVSAALLPKLTGERNIMLGCLAEGLSRQEVKEHFEDIVEFSGIGDFVYLPMNAYSSGMGSRLRFAISTAKVPDILMIDEALSTGDAEFQERSRDKILEIKDQAGTVFLVSHSAASVAAMCERCLWLEEGKLIMDGPTEQVLAAYDASKPRSKRRHLLD
ncbi:MAG: ABC transporter ATP-binding protein [Bifidobacteriaceae bacterium]|jgi:teichoic acid transport system ATP-binding protein|nr:ABC transporter ATP-binding protein [Bifidobacteriaceae bacterium]